MNFLLFIHPHVVPNLYGLLASAEHERRKTIFVHVAKVLQSSDPIGFHCMDVLFPSARYIGLSLAISAFSK